ncbi:MAG: YdcF family protein [Candidatus Tectomicrobia bacterium]|nr:YdcF family protein [Candidatus Tectomicrobia bacterium]
MCHAECRGGTSRLYPGRLRLALWRSCLANVPGLAGMTQLLADWLVVADPLQGADAILVLSGHVERLVAGYELYRWGYAPRLLVANQGVGRCEFNGQVYPACHSAPRILHQLGVPESALIVLREARSTYEEACAAATWMRRRNWRRLILVSSPYHMRRAVLTVRKQLSASDRKLIARPAPQSWFSDSQPHDAPWLRTVAHEYLGLGYYWLRGRV